MSRVVTLLLAMCWGASCSVNPELHVFNNTGSTLRVFVDGEPLAADPGAVLSFSAGGDLIVEFSSVKGRYALSMPPPDYVRTGPFRAHISLQLEADGRLFVLAVGGLPPIDVDSYPQPPGFPVLPVRHPG
jgi:hypothetical protein